MGNQKKPVWQTLPSCEVTYSTNGSGRLTRAGFMYMKNRRVVVLLNNLSGRADLGRLKKVRHHHVEPEAHIWICPRDRIESVKILW